MNDEIIHHSMQDRINALKEAKADNIAKLVPGQSDAEIANDLKARSIEIWKPLLALMEEAHKKGFEVQINAGLNELGQAFIHNIKIMKIYK